MAIGGRHRPPVLQYSRGSGVSRLRAFWCRVIAVARSGARDRDFDAEVAAHLAEAEDAVRAARAPAR